MDKMEQKLRIRFSKTGALRYIGHLDFLRVFQQMIRRAGIPIAYSQGFNPHQIISFALPLPLGMGSANDYADITVTGTANFKSQLCVAVPQGLTVLDVYPVVGSAAAAATVAADYILNVPVTDELKAAVKNILESETIVIPKKTKSGIKDTDIRPDILDIKTHDGTFLLRLSAGSARFLNPLIVAELICGGKVCPSLLTRQELYQQDAEKGLTSL